MHHRIVSILRRLKQDPARQLDRPAILDVCRQARHTWRTCLLDPVATVHLFLLQVLHGNTAINHLPRLCGKSFTDSAYCQARARLPLGVFEDLVRRVADGLRPLTEDAGAWHGHRAFVADGSGFSMPDTPELRAHFGQPGNQAPGCGFPVAHLLALFHVGTGMLLEVLTGPLCTHDMSGVARLHPQLRRGDVLLGDRGFCSFAHLALLMARGVHGVFRMHQRQVVDFTPHRPHARAGGKGKGLPSSRWLRGLGATDQLVAWLKPERRPGWMTAGQFASLPEELVSRELRYRIDRPGFRVRSVTLVTTLLDAEVYPAEALATLYRSRWQVELNLRHLKTTMRMDVLRCETVAGVSKELLVFALVYNLVRLVMLEASRRQAVAVDRISFVDALRWLAEARPGEVLPRLVVNPDRPDRVEPRVRKRRPKQYPLMKKPRSVLRKALLEQGVIS
jgi:DDE family transposase